jgi:asparagine synthase (glutamine-hydrolysing)
VRGWFAICSREFQDAINDPFSETFSRGSTMYRGFTVHCSASGTIEVRLSLFADRSGQRPSLVSLARDDASHMAALLLGKIFYRTDFFTRAPQLSNTRDTSDAALALAAYQHLGAKGLEQLEGEFALVVWDGKRRRLWAVRDPMGTWPLFWSHNGEDIVISSCLEMLVAEKTTQSVNLNTVAEFLMQPCPASELPCEQTAYNGIQRVLPGTMVALDLTGSVQRHTYWDWVSRIGQSNVATLDEAGEQFAGLLRQAVRERLPDGPVAAHLSGGMDSSSVVCLARNGLAARGNTSPLFTLALVYQRSSLVGERAYIDHVLRQEGPAEPHYLQADDVLDFDWFTEEIPYHAEPYSDLRSLPSQRILAQAADRVGAVTVLTGLGSDEITDYQPFHFADLLRRGRWITVLIEAAQWARASNRSLPSILRPYGLGPLATIFRRERRRLFSRDGYGIWPHLGWFTVPPWVRPGFAQKYHLRQRGQANARRMYGPPTALSWILFMLASTSGDWGRWYLTAPLGVNQSHPFRDPRLICFTLGLSRSLRAVPGMVKPVLQTAMRGILPEAIRTRPDKRGFDDVYGLGLTRNLPLLEQMVRSSAIRELGIFDLEKLISILHQASLGIGDVRACDRLDKTLAVIVWFDQIIRRPSAGLGPTYRWNEANNGRETNPAFGTLQAASC